MANAYEKIEPTYILELTRDEAQVLFYVLGSKIVGNNGGGRKHLSSIWDSMTGLNLKEVELDASGFIDFHN